MFLNYFHGKSTGEYKLAIYHLENYIQGSLKASSCEIEIENEEEIKEISLNYTRLFKVTLIFPLFSLIFLIFIYIKFYKYINEDFKFLDFQNISMKLKLPEFITIPEEKSIIDKAIFDDLQDWDNPTLAKTTSELIMNHHFNLYYNQSITYALINALLYHIYLLTQSEEYTQFKINRNLVENLFMTLKRSYYK